MKYLSSEPFSVAPGATTPDLLWDLAFMTKREFLAKYPERREWYAEQVSK